MIYIGIDTGTHTGVAVWDADNQRFTDIRTCLIHDALTYVLDIVALAAQTGDLVEVRVEDARLRTWFGPLDRGRSERSKLQGVGSVKRDCAIWEDFLQDIKAAWSNLDYRMVPPRENRTKLSADAFERITKSGFRTSEHARDAAMLVFGRQTSLWG